MNTRRLMTLSIVLMLVLACNIPSVNVTGGNPAEAASPSFPGTISPTMAPIVLSTSTIPLGSPNGSPLNCRSGPGTGWSVVIILNPGQIVEIVGKNPDGTWWYVKNPSLQGNFCWISASYTNTSGNLGGIPVVAMPPTVALPTPVPGAVEITEVSVTDVSVSVSPNTIHVGGCMGPIQPITLNAAITVNGAIKLQWHFETDQSGSLPTHSVNFKNAGTKDVSDSYMPPVTAGKYYVQLIIDGMNLKGMNAVASYKISC